VNDVMRYYEQFVLDDPDKMFRILPVGSFKRLGRKAEVTAEKIAEMVANFGTVPDTVLAVNAEHVHDKGKLGDVAAVEARSDGLYARLNWLDEGRQAVSSGKFQYFSPEILWGPIDYDGRQVKNVLMGLALTNQPFFGSSVAMYSLEDKAEEYRDFSPEQRRMMADKGEAMPDGSFPIATAADLSNAVQAWGRSDNQAGVKRHIIKRARALDRTDLLPADWEGSSKENENMSTLDKGTFMEALTEFFGQFNKPAPAPAPAPIVPVTETEEYKALVRQNEEAQQKLDAQAKEQRIAANVEKFSTGLKVDGWETPKDIPSRLAAVAEFDATLADGLATEFKALAEQAKAGKLFGEIGTSQPGGEGASDAEKFQAMSKAKAAEMKIDITEAYRLVAAENPELYKAYTRASAARARD